MKSNKKSSVKLDKKKKLIIIGAVLICVVALVLFLVFGGKVRTSVPKEYIDHFADSYASEINYDKDGNVKYVFEKENYDAFLTAYHEVVKEESRENLSTPHQYTHYNLQDPNDTANYGIVVGLGEGEYEQFGEEALKAEAKALGEAALKYQMNTKDPAKSIPVTYKEASTSEVYFVITVTAE